MNFLIIDDRDVVKAGAGEAAQRELELQRHVAIRVNSRGGLHLQPYVYVLRAGELRADTVAGQKSDERRGIQNHRHAIRAEIRNCEVRKPVTVEIGSRRRVRSGAYGHLNRSVEHAAARSKKQSKRIVSGRRDREIRQAVLIKVSDGNGCGICPGGKIHPRTAGFDERAVAIAEKNGDAVSHTVRTGGNAAIRHRQIQIAVNVQVRRGDITGVTPVAYVTPF